mmetsp:Transcript_3805/g.7412  ORF Transcript_3805/g.7412 Transcript_3805/m.7412 type:complete len:245 (-) Transcript_3805:1787-2521(-)
MSTTCIQSSIPTGITTVKSSSVPSSMELKVTIASVIVSETLRVGSSGTIVASIDSRAASSAAVSSSVSSSLSLLPCISSEAFSFAGVAGGAPCCLHTSYPLMAALGQPSCAHVFPPLCSRHRLERPRTVLSHPSLEQLRGPPPWALHIPLTPLACLLQPSTRHIFPPPCSLQRTWFSTAIMVQPLALHWCSFLCWEQYTLSPRIALSQFSCEQRFPPPCTLQNVVLPKKGFVHPSCWHRPCSTQ